MRILLIVVGITSLLALSGGILAWRTVRQWSRKGPSKQTLAHPGAPADLRMRVTVEQSTERLGQDRPNYDFSEVNVVLSNAVGKAVEAPEIHAGVNGVPLTFAVPVGNYYDRRPQYRLRDDARLPLVADSVCDFTLGWGETPSLPAATIRLPKGIVLANFNVPETHSAAEPLVISWSDLGTAADLVIYKTVTFTDEQGNHGFISGSVNSEDALRKKIGPGLLRSASGKLTIPASYFTATNGERASTLHLEVKATTVGIFMQAFLPDGSIEAVRKLTFHVELLDAAAPVAKAEKSATTRKSTASLALH